MYTATIKNVAPGKADASAIYCETKSGNIYKLRTSVPAERATTVIAQIKSAKVINIQHWIKVKEGTFTPKPAKTKAPRPEYKEVVIKDQAARIKELQAQVKALKAQLTEAPSDAALEEMEIQASIDTANKRSIAAKKGWETRRSNAEDIEHATKMWEFEKSGDEAGAIAYLESRTTPMWDELKAQEADSGLAS